MNRYLLFLVLFTYSVFLSCCKKCDDTVTCAAIPIKYQEQISHEIGDEIVFINNLGKEISFEVYIKSINKERNYDCYKGEMADCVCPDWKCWDDPSNGYYSAKTSDSSYNSKNGSIYGGNFLSYEIQKLHDRINLRVYLYKVVADISLEPLELEQNQSQIEEITFGNKVYTDVIKITTDTSIVPQNIGFVVTDIFVSQEHGIIAFNENLDNKSFFLK